MRLTGHAAALLAIFALSLPAGAQGVREISGPRETPPASFQGPQYVDSGGCVFVRAGVDGRVVWVPRVNAQRKVLCGYPPTQPAAATPQPTVVAEAAPVPAPVVQTPQSKPKAPRATPAAAPKTKAKRTVADDYVAAPVQGWAPGTLRCPARAPIATRAPLRGGGSVILCLSRSGILDEQASVATLNAAAPVAASAKATTPGVVVCPRSAPVAQRIPLRGGGSTVLCTAGDGSLTGIAVPKQGSQPKKVARIAIPAPAPPVLLEPVIPAGYKLAWSDDRLNANRARGTVAGQLAQDQIWTRETPARLVSRKAERGHVTVSTQDSTAALRISTSGQSSAARYVQVGSFGRAANAQAAQARLRGMGLPVASVRASGGKLKIVLAGPFDGTEAARLALKVVRSGGFPDAVLR